MASSPSDATAAQYDARTVQKVLSLAASIQGRTDVSYSAAEIEALGAEAGLQPSAVREALAQVTARVPDEIVQSRRREFWRLVGASGCGAAWGGLLLALSPYLDHGSKFGLLRDPVMAVATLVLPPLLGIGLGFAVKRRVSAFVAAAWLAAMTAPAFGLWVFASTPVDRLGAWLAALGYVVIGGVVGGGFGLLGASARNYYFPQPEGLGRLPAGELQEN